LGECPAILRILSADLGLRNNHGHASPPTARRRKAWPSSKEVSSAAGTINGRSAPSCRQSKRAPKIQPEITRIHHRSNCRVRSAHLLPLGASALHAAMTFAARSAGSSKPIAWAFQVTATPSRMWEESSAALGQEPPARHRPAEGQPILPRSTDYSAPTRSLTTLATKALAELPLNCDAASRFARHRRVPRASGRNLQLRLTQRYVGRQIPPQGL